MTTQEETQTARFEGWAIVEIMGHRRVAGFVTTEAFGSVVMFRVTAPEIPETEETLDRDQYFDGHMLGKGSRIATGRPRISTLIGSGSVYQMTECTERAALAANPLASRIVERVALATKELPSITAGIFSDQDIEGDGKDY